MSGCCVGLLFLKKSYQAGELRELKEGKRRKWNIIDR
jgi:hypothetical protein